MEFFSEFSCFSKFWRCFIKFTINCKFLSILFNFCARSLIFQYQQFISRNKKNNNKKKKKRIYNAGRISFDNHIFIKLRYFHTITIFNFLQIINKNAPRVRPRLAFLFFCLIFFKKVIYFFCSSAENRWFYKKPPARGFLFSLEKSCPRESESEEFYSFFSIPLEYRKTKVFHNVQVRKNQINSFKCLP